MDEVLRINPCVDIKYPFTEEGKPACLSVACPKNDNCKECCKADSDQTNRIKAACKGADD